MTQEERRKHRDLKVKRYFSKMLKNHPQWRYMAILEKVANEFNISENTVRAIIKGYGRYS